MKRTALYILVFITVSLFAIATVAIASQEKETVDEAKPIITGWVSVPVPDCDQQRRIRDFDSQVAEWMKGVPFGASITIKPEALQTDPSKECLLFAAVGDDIENHVVRPFPVQGITFVPKPGINPVHIFAVLKEGYRRDTSFLKARGGLWRIFAAIPIIGPILDNLGGGKITADVRSSARYSFQVVPMPRDWPWTPVWAARFMQHMGSGGAASFDLSPTAEELAVVNAPVPGQAHGPSLADIEVVKAHNNAKMAKWERAHNEWLRLPRTKKEVSRKTRQQLVSGVLRFLERTPDGSSRLSSWSGTSTVWAWDPNKSERYKKFAEVQVTDGQGIVPGWCLGQWVSVDYGTHRPHVQKVECDGYLTVTYQSQRVKPDQLRRNLTLQGLRDALRDPDHFNGFSGLLREHGLTYSQFCDAWRAGQCEVGSVSPCQRFTLVSGAGIRQVSQSWSPSSEEPALWFTVNGEKLAVQQLVEGNLLLAKLLPEPEPLRPVMGQGVDERVVERPCAIPPEPKRPALEPIPTPVAEAPNTWQGQVSGLRGLDASQSVSTPQTLTEWQWLLPFARQRLGNCLPPVPGSPYCPPVGSTPGAFPAPDPAPGFSGR